MPQHTASLDQASARWRAMEPRDLAAVHALSAGVHPDYPERAEVLGEKFRLFPRGCFVLERGARIAGYCFSHPWMADAPPALDSLLGALPATPATYFIHDLTIDETVRGQGHGRALVPDLLEAARSVGLLHVTLIAVNRRGPFWQAAGFSVTPGDALQVQARAKYGAGAVHMGRRLPGF